MDPARGSDALTEVIVTAQLQSKVSMLLPNSPVIDVSPVLWDPRLTEHRRHVPRALCIQLAAPASRAISSVKHHRRRPGWVPGATSWSESSGYAYDARVLAQS